MRLRVLADIPESPLSDICQHPPPRLPIGRLKRSKIKKPPLAVKKTGCSPEQKELLWEAPPQQPEAPPQPSPRGGSPYLLCLRAFEWRSFPLGKAWDGAPVGWYAPQATLTELRLAEGVTPTQTHRHLYVGELSN